MNFQVKLNGRIRSVNGLSSFFTDEEARSAARTLARKLLKQGKLKVKSFGPEDSISRNLTNLRSNGFHIVRV